MVEGAEGSAIGEGVACGGVERPSTLQEVSPRKRIKVKSAVIFNMRRLSFIANDGLGNLR